jgi:hypothetical protein
MMSRLRKLPLAGLCCLLIAWLGSASVLAAPPNLDNAGCLGCHENKKAKIEVVGEDDDKRALRQLDTHKFAKGVHGELQCVSCHTDIVDNQANHKKDPAGKRPDCVSCHQELWAKTQAEGKGEEKKGWVLLSRTSAIISIPSTPVLMPIIRHAPRQAANSAIAAMISTCRPRVASSAPPGTRRFPRLAARNAMKTSLSLSLLQFTVKRCSKTATQKPPCAPTVTRRTRS